MSSNPPRKQQFRLSSHTIACVSRTYSVDEDGDLDILVAHLTDGILLMRNDATCSFEEAPPIPLPTAESAVIDVLTSMLVIDADGDGRLDVLILRGTGVAALVRFEESSIEATATGLSFANGSAVALSASAGDANDDGLVDVVVATSRGVLVYDGASMASPDVVALSMTTQPAGVAYVASVATIASETRILSLVDDVGGQLLKSPRSETTSDDTLLIRVMHRRGNSFAALFGAVVRVLGTADGLLAASAAHVDGGGNQVQEGAVVRVAGLSADALYTVEVAIATREGGRFIGAHNVTVNGTTLLSVGDTLDAPAFAATPPDGCVGIGDEVTLTFHSVADETGLLLGPGAVWSGVNNSDGSLSAGWAEHADGVYTLSRRIVEGEAGWAPDDVPLSIVLIDAQGFESEAFPWPDGARAACADAHRPTALFDALPPQFTREASAAFVLTCTELDCSYEFRVNDDPWDVVGSRTNSSEGASGGAAAAIGAPPGAILASAPPRHSSSPVADFTVLVYGVNATAVEYILDGDTAWAPTFGASMERAGLADGEHTVQLRAGPADPAPIRYSWIVDTEAPSVAVIHGPSLEVSSGKVVVATQASEEGCRLRHRLVSAPLPDVSDASDTAARAALGTLPRDDDEAGWRVVADSIIEVDAADGFAHRLEMAAVDRAGNVGAVIERVFAREGCDEVPEVSVSNVVVSSTGRVVIFESEARILETRVIHGDFIGAWQATAARDVRSLLAEAAFAGPGVIHAIEARAFVECVPHTGRPAPARHEWEEPAAPLPLEPVLLSAPNAVSTLRAAEFSLTTTHGDDGGDLECAYGFAPLGAVESDIRYAGGSNGGRVAAWRPCTLVYRLEPLSIGRHRMRVRVVGADDVHGEVVHDWSVQSADASAFTVTGRDTGTHSVQIRATDVADNLQSAAPHSFSWEVDRTPPDTRIDRLSPALSMDSVAYVNATCVNEPRPESCTFCWTSSTLPSDCGGVGETLLEIIVPAAIGYEGVHVVHIAAVDGAGNTDATPAELSWTVDRVAPAINISAPGLHVHEGNAYTSELRPHVAVAATEALASYSVHAGDVVSYSGAVAPEHIEFTVAAVPETEPPLPDGEHIAVRVNGVDPAGNIGELSAPLNFVVDTSAPAIVVGVAPAGRHNSTTATIGFTGEPGATDPLLEFHATYRVEQDPHVGATTIAVSETAVGPSSIPIAPLGATGESAHGELLLPNLVDGALYTVAVAAEDLAGNMGNESRVVVFAVDLRPPVVSFVAEPASFSNETGVVELLVRSTEGGCAAAMSVVGPSGGLIATATAKAGDDEVEFAIHAGELHLVDGAYSISVSVSDEAGNQASTTLLHEVVIDTEPPELSASLPFVGRTRFTADRQVALTMTCTDANTCSLTVSLDLDRLEEVVPLLVAPNQLHELDLRAKVDGSHSVTLVATDAAGNAGAPANVTWVFDVTPPRLRSTIWHARQPDADTGVIEPLPEAFSWAIDTDAADGGTSNGGAAVAVRMPAPALLAKCTDQDGSTCVVQAKLAQLEPATTVCGADAADTPSGGTDRVGPADAPYSVWTDVASPGVVERFPALADGKWRIELRAVDEAGNAQNASGTAQHTWFVDTESPGLPSLVFQSDALQQTGVTADAAVSLVAELTDASPLMASARVLYSVDDQSGSNAQEAEVIVTGNTLTGAFVITNTEDGEHAVSVWVVDAAGNAGPKASRTWQRLSALPTTRIEFGPADEVGVDVVSVGVVGLAEDGTTVLRGGVYFEAKLNAAEWQPVCESGNSASEGTMSPSGVCTFDVVADQVQPHALQVRTVSAAGRDDAPALIRWTRKNCPGQQYATIDRGSGAISCTVCPTGADCEASDLIEKEQVQAQAGFWHGGNFDFCECARRWKCPVVSSSDAPVPVALFDSQMNVTLTVVRARV